MTAILSVGSVGHDSPSARVDRTTVAIGKALTETRRDGEAMVRLIEAAAASGKGQHVNYRA
ncbi:MAG: hypothetical protein IT182_09540 [Acidobacteria bacterium]|nr:hypothetical protein [Acidobacteriota bacterium]